MKSIETIPQQQLQSKQTERQLQELIESYYHQVGNDMLPIIQISFNTDNFLSIIPTNQKAQLKKKKIKWGKLILHSTALTLLFTMFISFKNSAVLAFGLFWGVLFTRYQAKLQNDMREMLMYWIIFGLMTALQNFLSLALFFMPFYHSLKLFFLISLLYPRINLKTKIYKEYFLPRLVLLSKSLRQKQF